MLINLPQSGHAIRPFMLVFLLASLGCDPSKRNTETAASRPTVDDITDDATPFLGQTVTVTGEIGRIGGPHLFTIEDSNPVGEQS